MGRGLLSGLFWGGVASMVVLIVVSLYYPMRELAGSRSLAPAPEPLAESAAEATPQAARPDPEPEPEVAPSASRPLLADPPPPAAGAELSDTPPDAPSPVTTSDAAPELAERPEDTPVGAADPVRPVLPDTAQNVPSTPAPAAPTTTPEAAPAPEALAPSVQPTEPDAPAAPPPAPAPSEFAAAPSAIVPAPPQEAAPQAEAAPAPTVLPTPDAAEAIAAPAPPPQGGPARVPIAAVPAPLPDLPERPGGPVPPGAAGRAPVPDTARIAMPALIGETPMPDTEAAQAGEVPDGLGLPPFSGAPEQTVPAQPDLRLAALTRPITEGPPLPRAVPTPAQSEAPAPDQPAETAPDAVPATPAPDDNPAPAPARPQPGFVITQPSEDPPEDPIARLQPAESEQPEQPEQAAPARTLPRRIVVGGEGAQDGASRLSARFGASNRLPQIGAAPEPDGGPPAEDVQPEGSDDRPVGALARNAQPWDGAGPRAAIVLQATGPDRAITEILAGIPLPLAVALDPSWPDADARAEALRTAGHEVLITLTGLPPRPELRDLDVALNAHIARLPGAVGVYLPPDSPVGNDRELLTHLAARLTQTGHGLVAEARGLSVLAQIARSEGTALAAVDDVLMPQAPAVEAARALDRAMFEAARGGSFLLLGQTRADTLIALQDWTRSAEAGLAPVSAILLEDS